MFDIYFIINSFIVSSLLGIGFVSVIKDSHSKTNRTFFALTLAVSFWIISNSLSNSISLPVWVVLYANRAIFGFSCMVVILVLKFAVQYTEDIKWTRLISKNEWFLWSFVPLFFSPLVARQIHLQGNVYGIDFGVLAPIYALFLFGGLGLSAYIFWKNMRQTHGAERIRLKTIFLIIVVAGALLCILQFILPAVTGWFGLSNIGLLPVVGIVFGLYYLVAKQRLFNITPNLLRSIVYVLTLVSLTFVYLAISVTLLSLVHGNDNLLTRNILNGLLLLIALISYRPLLSFYKRVTDHIFLQDSYDSQELYAELNKVLVSSVDIHNLLIKATSLIASRMKLKFCAVILRSNEGDGYRVFGVNSKLHQNSLELLFKYTANSKRKIFITEQISKSKVDLRQLLESMDIGALSWMETKITSFNQSRGYLLVGNKLNGYSLNKEDSITIEATANELAIAVQNALHFEEIQNFNSTLQQKVEDATRKLRVTNEKLKRMDETKDEFISMASHQLRTPLTSVKGYVSMVLDGDVGPITTQQRELLQQSFVSSQRMANLISDMLNLSRINTGKFVIEPTEVYLPKVIEAELSQLREIAANKNIDLKLDVPAEFPTLLLDEGKMHQVIMNLVDNALYYTPDGGKVTIELLNTPSAIELRVVDTGIGVPRDAQKHLFTKMYRAENARLARPDGTGLGLFLVKKVILAQGGSIIFETEENKGSTFGFRFNKARHGATTELLDTVSTDTAS